MLGFVRITTGGELVNQRSGDNALTLCKKGYCKETYRCIVDSLQDSIVICDVTLHFNTVRNIKSASKGWFTNKILMFYRASLAGLLAVL